MTMDRRDFLKFVIGGAVGTVFTPLPWVTMDEVAKWSQRWAPVAEKGGTSYRYTTCRLCPGGCGIRVRLIEEKRAVKIDGNPDHPLNRGSLCPLGLAGLQYLYGEENRVKTPLKRTGPRGGKDWKPVSWEEALSEIAALLKDLRGKGLPHTVAFLDGEGDGTQAFLVERFLKAYGSPNALRPFRRRDLEEILTQNLHDRRLHFGYDLPGSDYVLSFGAPILEDWENPCWSAAAFREWRKKEGPNRTRFIQIDGYLSTSASLADDWIALRPGTEGILALGLARILIEQGRSPLKAAGLKELQDYLNEQFPLERVARETEVPQATLLRLAKEFSSAQRPLAVWGKGRGEPPITLFEAKAVYLLNLLVGSVNRPGGIYLKESASFQAWSPAPLDETARRGLAHPRLDEAFSSRFPFSGNLEHRFWLNASRKGANPLQVLFLHQVNPVFTIGKSPVLEALEKIPLVVSFSTFLDETSAFSDWILPSPTFLERWDDCVSPPTVPFTLYGLTKPVLPPVHDTMALGDFIIQLARRLGGTLAQAFPFENLETAIRQTAMGLYRSPKGKIVSAGEGQGSPAAPDSFDKFWEQLTHFAAWVQEEVNGEAVKTVQLGSLIRPKGEVGPTAETKDLPYRLIVRSLPLLQNGYFPNPPFLTKLLGVEILQGKDLVIQLHPKTAKTLALIEGDRVEIRTPKGKMTARVHLFEGIRPDGILVPLGLGHEAFDATLKGRGANPNPLLEKVEDPATGLFAGRPTPAAVRKI
jgi:anaerobic selenocysteine-containing dehydrogenase